MSVALHAASLALSLLAARPSAVHASVVPDTSALQFFGFRAGASLGELDQLLRRLDGGRLRCQRAKADRRVSECRANLNHTELGGSVSIWVSAIDSAAGVITLSSAVSADRLESWRRRIEAKYGQVRARAQGAQWMMQWVRRGRMLRLTWKMESSGRTASVSLVDGRILDAWGKRQTRTAASAPP
jgi:hypothetical protein